jgi:D-alanine-D-alanine ligase
LNTRLRIAVLSGGTTAESRASRVSAGDVSSTLEASGYDVVWLDLSDREEWEVRPAESSSMAPKPGTETAPASWQAGFAALVRASGVDLAFPLIHGPIGEDGQLQALCESLALPYVGCGPRASTVCFDKAVFKRLVRDAGLPVAPWIVVERPVYDDDPAAIAAAVDRELGFPCIVKPSRSGSSLGLARVETRHTLDAAIRQAFNFDDVVLVEQLFSGSDVEIGVLEDGTAVVGTPVELEYDGVLYDFETKYAGDRDMRYVPARFPVALIARLERTARDVFVAAGCRGLARVDLLVDADAGCFVVNEVNTIPYMPAPSTFATSLCHATGRTYGDLVTTLVHRAWSAFECSPATR